MFCALFSNGVGIFDLFATLIIISAVILQIVSDQQMYKFRQDPNNANKVMDKGLWFYSRHPNYLGEILFWSGGLIFALGSTLSNIWLIGGIDCNVHFNSKGIYSNDG